MTTSDTFGGYAPPPPASDPSSPASTGRVLRRARGGRVAAGVSAGLGEYFGVDPVLFRVLFATSAFFGGAGILAYLLAWAAIPEAGTERALIDGWVAALRRRRVPALLVAVVAAGLFWLAAFSWWAPGPFFPVFAVVILLAVFLGRRELRTSAAAAPPSTPEASTVNLAKTITDDPAGAPTAEAPTDRPSDQPNWVNDARSWFHESREASRRRRRRAFPVRITILATLIVTLTALGIADAVTGIEMQIYFWTTLAIVGAGLLVGLVARRFPASMTPLLIPAIAGAVAFGGSHASLHDGVGQREWRPVASPASDYRLAVGQGTLNLSALATQAAPRMIQLTMGAGQVRIIAPRSLNLTVIANIHFGQLEVDGRGSDRHSGVGLSRTVGPPAGATGAPITVDVHLADGSLDVVHQ